MTRTDSNLIITDNIYFSEKIRFGEIIYYRNIFGVNYLLVHITIILK